jgi:hypothetical protein
MLQNDILPEHLHPGMQFERLPLWPQGSSPSMTSLAALRRE